MVKYFSSHAYFYEYMFSIVICLLWRIFFLTIKITFSMKKMRKKKHYTTSLNSFSKFFISLSFARWRTELFIFFIQPCSSNRSAWFQLGVDSVWLLYQNFYIVPKFQYAKIYFHYYPKFRYTEIWYTKKLVRYNMVIVYYQKNYPFFKKKIAWRISKSKQTWRISRWW